MGSVNYIFHCPYSPYKGFRGTDWFLPLLVSRLTVASDEIPLNYYRAVDAASSTNQVPDFLGVTDLVFGLDYIPPNCPTAYTLLQTIVLITHLLFLRTDFLYYTHFPLCTLPTSSSLTDTLELYMYSYYVFSPLSFCTQSDLH